MRTLAITGALLTLLAGAGCDSPCEKAVKKLFADEGDYVTRSGVSVLEAASAGEVRLCERREADWTDAKLECVLKAASAAEAKNCQAAAR